jgi:hypothetical protein
VCDTANCTVGSLTVVGWNIGGVVAHKLTCISIRKGLLGADLIFLCEIKSRVDVQLDGYTVLCRKNREKGRGGGCVFLCKDALVKEFIKHHVDAPCLCLMFNVNASKIQESHHAVKQLYIVGWYLPPTPGNKLVIP